MPIPGTDLTPETKILVVDDMTTVRQEIVACLKILGFKNISEAKNGKEAWEKLRMDAQFDSPFEFIFTDINMPHCNGIQLLKYIRGTETYTTTPVVMISTENEKDIILTAIQEGASNYILKPFTADIIKEKSKKLVR